MIDYCNAEKEVPDDWHRYHAAVDGEIVAGCIEADVAEGRAVCFVYDDEGHPVIRTDVAGIQRETKTGAVEIIHDDDLEAWNTAQKG